MKVITPATIYLVAGFFFQEWQQKHTFESQFVAMIYITQLVYVIPGKEDVFDAFEAVAIPAIAKYGGILMLRSRGGAVIE